MKISYILTLVGISTISFRFKEGDYIFYREITSKLEFLDMMFGYTRI